MFKILMVLGVTQNHHLIFLSLAVFKYLNFIDFGTWALSVNKLHRTSFKLFQLNNFRYNTKKTRSETFQHVHSILNIIKYGLIPLVLIPEKLATFYEYSSGKYLPDIIWNSMWLQRCIFRNDWYFKIFTVWILN